MSLNSIPQDTLAVKNHQSTTGKTKLTLKHHQEDHHERPEEDLEPHFPDQNLYLLLGSTTYPQVFFGRLPCSPGSQRFAAPEIALQGVDRAAGAFGVLPGVVLLGSSLWHRSSPWCSLWGFWSSLGERNLVAGSHDSEGANLQGSIHPKAFQSERNIFKRCVKPFNKYFQRTMRSSTTSTFQAKTSFVWSRRQRFRILRVLHNSCRSWGVM